MGIKQKRPNMGEAAVSSGRGATTGKLMDSQDRIGKGDAEDNMKIPTTLLLPADLKQRAKDYAESHGTSVTWLVKEGLYKILDELEGRG